MRTRKDLLAMLLAVAIAGPAAGANSYFVERPDVKAFIDAMVAAHSFDRAELENIIGAAVYQPHIIELMTRPAEAKPWFEYRPIFLTDDRIQLGIEFWERNSAVLEQAETRFGVDPAVVVAVIGVETKYGRVLGSHRVIDALMTLAFDYPKRGGEFQGYLEQFLLLVRQEELDALELKGSYAGAMGMGQFMPGSYLEYAVDFDGDGIRNMWSNNSDVIGSVANYLNRHGWKAGGPVADPVRDAAGLQRPISNPGLRPVYPLSQMRDWGYAPVSEFEDDSLLATLISLEGRNGTEHWLGFQNFYAITRYNHSPLYAMAVYQLSREIEDQRRQR